MAAPSTQRPFAAPDSAQLGLQSHSQLGQHSHPQGDEWNPLEWMSGISPYHDAPGADIRPPDGCKVASAAFLVRHSSIHCNDEEYYDWVESFVSRLAAFRASGNDFPDQGPLAFLQDWHCPINEDNLEELTEPGRRDAFKFGKRLRKLYPKLFPPKDLGSKKGKDEDKDGKVKTPYRVWSASSSRDVETAKAWIKGAFPKRHEGDDGEGDGQYLSLVRVPNKDPDWKKSLTPHKACPAFSKEPGKVDAQEWLQHYGPPVLERFRGMVPDFPWKLEDVIAFSMLCGYESVIYGVGKSEFCRPGLLDMEDFRNFGYWNDLIYAKMVGYDAPVAPYLGIPWITAATHNILASPDDGHEHDLGPHAWGSPFKDKLPGPDKPPNGTHSQKTFIYFTHREEPPVALVALGIWNQTKVGPLPTDRRPDDRHWMTSHVLPFLGHVAIEKLECGSKKPKPFVRVLVNGAAQRLPRPELSDGPGGSCEMGRFQAYVKERAELYGDFTSACRAP